MYSDKVILAAGQNNEPSLHPLYPISPDERTGHLMWSIFVILPTFSPVYLSTNSISFNISQTNLLKYSNYDKYVDFKFGKKECQAKNKLLVVYDFLGRR